MAMFKTVFEMRRALVDAGLQALANDIAATARPAIIFTRRQADDDVLPVGTGKAGGLPDLPQGFPWPTRAPLADADEYIEALRTRRAEERERAASYDHEAGYNAILAVLSGKERDDFIRSIEASRPDPQRLADMQAEQDRYDDLMAASFGREFPLAFLAQFNLQALSVEAGFDLDLPEHGMLSLFEDITSDYTDGAIHVFWFPDDIASLKRQSPPAELVALSDAGRPDIPWAELTKAEVMEPHSVLTVPFHWAAATGHRPDVYGFLHQPSTGYYPQTEEPADDQAGFFGDRLGGWPEPIQSDPETEIQGLTGSLVPGDDRIRHLVSLGGEYYAGTRRMHEPFGGDGTTYLMIPRDLLLEKRLDEARALYQCD